VAPACLFLWRWGLGGTLLLAMTITLASTRPAYADGAVDIKSYTYTDPAGKIVTKNVTGNTVDLPISAAQNDIDVFISSPKQGGEVCNVSIKKLPDGTATDLSPNVTGVANGFKVKIPANTMAQNERWSLQVVVNRGLVTVGGDQNTISIPPP
jgi:hypothetical protein